MSPSRTQLKCGLQTGSRKGWGSFVWICKILIPTSFLIILIQWSGLLYQAVPLLNPLMRLINLPGEAALPIISGVLIGPYTTIPIVTIIPFSLEQITLIAIFTMIAHSLIIEGIIQHKSGINAAKITLIRLASAMLTVFIVSQFFDDTTRSIIVPAYLTVTTPFVEVLKVWGMDTIELLIKIFIIIMVVMVALECLKSLGWMEYLLKISQPVMKILGLSYRTALLWITAVVFGLVYGGAIIVEEAKRGTLTKEELERLHISIGTNHSMVEEPALWLALGLNGFWLWVPRLITAATVVQIYGAVSYFRKKLAER
jgi:spore maturation protein SpmB